MSRQNASNKKRERKNPRLNVSKLRLMDFTEDIDYIINDH